MATPYFTLTPENQQHWDNILSTIHSFVNDTYSDADATYDYVVEQLGLPFVENKQCFDLFYDEWSNAYYYDKSDYNQPNELTGWN